MSNIWLNYILFFALFAKSLWFFYYFSLYAFRRKVYTKDYKGRTALIVPCYNEDVDKLEDTIKHALECDGIDEYYFIDDGSTNNTQEIFHKYRKTKINFIVLPKNVGKREAQKVGWEKASKITGVFVCMDSDTILQKDSVIKLLRPFEDMSVGSTTACILVRNKDKNIVTRAISSMYWSASKIWRNAPSTYDVLQTNNGQLSAYRASIIRDIIPRYVTQTFMGGHCAFSDDRYLTHHIQTDYNKKCMYVDDAEVHTYVPETMKQAYTMFLRWKLGAFRESFLVLKHFKKTPILIIDIWANHLVQFMQLIVRIAVIIISIFYSPIVILYYLFIVMIISLLYSFHMIWYSPKQVPFKLLYSLMNEFYFSWAFIWALITVKEQGKWATR